MQEEGTTAVTTTETTETPTETPTGSITVDKIEQPVNVQELRTETVFETTQGTIHLVHEMTLGDVVIVTLLMFILIFHILDRFIRR